VRAGADPADSLHEEWHLIPRLVLAQQLDPAMAPADRHVDLGDVLAVHVELEEFRLLEDRMERADWNLFNHYYSPSL
jgi:hypothetical protein